jgi:ribosomal protein S18 acetylase RimI-like enzyme
MLRLATFDDLSTLLQLNATCYPEDIEDSTTNSRLTKVFSSNPSWVIEEGGKIVACLLSEISAGRPYIWSVATLPAHRGKGLASTLIKEFEKHYSEQGLNNPWLHVRADNPAQKLYFDLGYRVASFGKNIYGSNIHGLVMKKRTV